MSVTRRIKIASFGLALASAAAISPTAATAATAAGGDGDAVLQFCRSMQSQFPGNITGGCVSYYSSHLQNGTPAGFASSVAYFCRFFAIPNGFFTNEGTCEVVVRGYGA